MSDTIERVLTYATDLDKPIKKTYLDTIFATEDNLAHRFVVALERGGEPVALPGGAAVSATLIRYSDNATVPLTGSIAGHVVSVTLTRACYAKAGQFALIIKGGAGSAVGTVFYGEGTVFTSSTDTIVDTENVVPSLSDLLAQIDAMEAATASANAAAGNANASASNADVAATRANNAGAAIEGLTVASTTLAAGSAATAKVSDVSGHKHIAFGIPTGPIPNITFSVSTGEPGTQVQLSQGGTVAAPTVHLTIPRGDTGAIDGIDYYAGTPAKLGTGSPGTANGVARGDHVHPMPSASDVGALASGGTAANASKLDGKTLSDILLAIYPVGAIYISTVSTSPATLFGGTWTQIKDRFLLATGDTFSPGWEAGQSEVTLTVENMPEHTHRLNGHAWNWGTKSGYSNPIYIADTDANVGYTTSNGLGTDQGVGNVTQETGGGQAHDNMPPYVAVYMWKRTA